MRFLCLLYHKIRLETEKIHRSERSQRCISKRRPLSKGDYCSVVFCGVYSVKVTVTVTSLPSRSTLIFILSPTE